MDSKKLKRRWYQFSLLTLMILVTLFTVAFGGWVQYRRYRARENRERVAAVEDAVAWIENKGAEVVSKYTELRSQTWLEKQFDDPGGPSDSVGVLAVTRVHFKDTNVTDAGLEHLKGLTKLEFLSLDGTKVTDAGLAHLKELTNLKTLVLDNTNVTDAGLEHLKGLTNLCDLSLEYTKVSDAGLVHIKGLTSLEWLNLLVTNVTDAGLIHLRDLKNLKYLIIAGTQITNEGVEKLQQALPECLISKP